jgi:hypothetical protein
LKVRSKGNYNFRASNGTFLKLGDNSSAGIFQSKIKNTKIGDLEKLGSIASKTSISVGYRKGETHKGSGLTYAYLASILELGTKDGRIPPRPYLSLSSKIIVPSLDREIAKALRRLTLGPKPLTKASMNAELLAVAKVAENKTKQIIKTRAVPVIDNSLSTLSQKEDIRPWIDSGELVEAIVGQIRVT